MESPAPSVRYRWPHVVASFSAAERRAYFTIRHTMAGVDGLLPQPTTGGGQDSTMLTRRRAMVNPKLCNRVPYDLRY
jgi:hypothetical protein